MSKLPLKLFSIILVFAMTLSSVTTFASSKKDSENSEYILANGESFTKIETENSIQFFGVTGNVEADENKLPSDIVTIENAQEYQSLSNSTDYAKNDIATTSANTLPDSVDNSNSKYFPEIGNQGNLGSCTFWAQVYYQFTYMMNKDMDVATTSENTFSPQWAYNLVAGTNEMIGPYYDTYTFMKKQGNVFLSQVPYTQNATSFSPTEDVWKTSIKYRIKDYQLFKSVGNSDSLITDVNDEDLNLIKTALSNGEVLAYSTYINSWNTVSLKTNQNAPQNNNYKGQYAVTSQIGSNGPHRMTLVGYNDNIWIDINDNDKVDSGEMGAFKIANSWGKGYGNNGFMWIAYDALNEVSCVEGVKAESSRKSIFSEISRIEVLKHGTDSSLYLLYTVNTCDRTQVGVSLTAEKDGTISTRQAYSNHYSGEKIAYDGSKNATDATMVLLLSNVVEDISAENFDDYSFSVNFQDKTKDSNVFTVKKAEIIDESTGTVYSAENAFPFTLDGEKKTITLTKTKLNHAVVYYRGYKNPKINYKTGNGSFISESGVELSENIERRGYTHKYVIDLGEDNSAMLYFSDSNNNIDNNDGKLFTATRGLNYYVTENVSTPVSISITNNFDSLADVDQCCNFYVEASGGYAPYMYRYTIKNLDTNEETVKDFTDKSSTEHYFRTEGNYKVTVEVMDYSDEIFTVSTQIKIEDIPFSFDRVNTEKDCNFVGENIAINAVTKNEKIKYTGTINNKYTFVIKDEHGNTCYTSTEKCNKYSLSYRYTETTKNIILDKSGTYTVTVSSTDGNNEYAEKTTSFTVFDKTYGDSNADGSVDIMDATNTQRFIASVIGEDDIKSELADCDLSGDINIIDATLIQRYIASLDNTAQVGKIIEYIPPVKPTEPITEPTEKQTEPTEKPTDPPVTKDEVTFTNSFNWSGTIYCYYWSDKNTAMTSWPGVAMTNAGKNDFGETLYTFEVPNGVNYIIFSNGSTQTTDIKYSGGKVRYYPLSETDSKGHNKVQTW